MSNVLRPIKCVVTLFAVGWMKWIYLAEISNYLKQTLKSLRRLRRTVTTTGMNSDTGERRHIDMGNIDQIGTSERVGSFEATTKLWAVPFQC